VIPDKFTYLAPTSLPEVWQALLAHPDETKILAGGQSLIPLMKFRLATPAYVVDLRKVMGLDTLEERDGALVIGAMVRENALERSGVVRRRYTGAYEASSVVADPIVRNFATVGGNLAHADPANDHPAMMVAMRAQVMAQGPNGQRMIGIDDFLVDMMETSLRPEEVLTAIHIPTPTQRTGSAYVKFERKVGDYAIAAVAAQITLDGDICTQAGIGLTNVGPKAIRATQAEAFLVGKRMTMENVQEAARLAAEAAQPSSDLRGPEAYKRKVVRALAARAIRSAADRAFVGGVQ
jgi:aerobic carbon-monoxide dehydrogenase medium subunit